MKNLKIKKVSVFIAGVMSAQISVAQTTTTTPVVSLNPVRIESVLPVVRGSNIPPNIFFTIDDSGSMRDHVPYDNAFDYTPPPAIDSAGLIVRDASGGITPMVATSTYSDAFAPFIPDHIDQYSGIMALGTTLFGFGTGQATGISACRNGGGNLPSSPTATELQNCYNYVEFYQTRNLLTKSSVAKVFAEADFDFDFGYSSINTTRFGGANNIYGLPNDIIASSGIPKHTISPAESGAFLSWLYSETAEGGTPGRDGFKIVGESIRSLSSAAQSNLQSIYKSDASGAVTSQPAVCKQNFHIFLSDGQWNQDFTRTNIGDYDNRFGSTRLDGIDVDGRPVSMSLSSPEAGLIAGNTNSLDIDGTNTLSDIALFDWNTDLSPAVVNGNVPYYTQGGIATDPFWDPKNDPTDRQHLVTFTIGLGIGDNMSSDEKLNMMNFRNNWIWNTSTIGGFLQATPDSKQDDLRHAAYAGRGDFIRVDNPKKLQEAFERIFRNIKSRTTTKSMSGSARVAQITDDSSNLLLTTSIDFASRTGDLLIRKVYSGNPNDRTVSGVTVNDLKRCFGSSAMPGDHFAGEVCSGGTDVNELSASLNTLPADRRNIYSYNNLSKKGVDFHAGNLSSPQITDILSLVNDTTITGDEAVEYLRGSLDLNNANKSVRSRVRIGSSNTGPVKLGDMGRTIPVFVGNSENFYFAKTRTPMIYTGGNDGMLHAFRADNAVEEFAYVPSQLFSNLGNLINPSDSHMAFVDGQLSIQDMLYLGGEEKTILVGSLGSGGSGIFALDITDPTSFGTDKVLWELGESDGLGRIMGKPSIIQLEGYYKGRLNTAGSSQKNRWVVVVSTGYKESASTTDGEIVIIDAVTGVILDKVSVPGSRGLGQMTWIDHQKHSSKLIIDSSFRNLEDRGYVADLNGNVYTIDFSADAFGDNKEPRVKKLFTATDKNGTAQLITAPLIVIPHPNNRGYLVYFGTGDLFGNDPVKKITNSMYAVWDDVDDNFGDEKITTRNTNTSGKPLNRSNLRYLPWTIKDTTMPDGKGGIANVSYRTLDRASISPIVWANWWGKSANTSYFPLNNLTGNPVSGWVSDAGSREQIFQKPFVSFSKNNEVGISFIASQIDTSGSSDPCLPGAGARSVVMSFRIDNNDGGVSSFKEPVSDINGDGKIDDSDKVTSSGTAGSLVPLGAVLKDKSGKVIDNGIIYSSTSSESSRKSGRGSCGPGETARINTVMSSDGSAIHSEVCLSRRLSSWAELE